MADRQLEQSQVGCQGTCTCSPPPQRTPTPPPPPQRSPPRAQHAHGGDMWRASWCARRCRHARPTVVVNGRQSPAATPVVVTTLLLSNLLSEHSLTATAIVATHCTTVHGCGDEVAATAAQETAASHPSINQQTVHRIALPNPPKSMQCCGSSRSVRMPQEAM